MSQHAKISPTLELKDLADVVGFDKPGATTASMDSSSSSSIP